MQRGLGHALEIDERCAQPVKHRLSRRERTVRIDADGVAHVAKAHLKLARRADAPVDEVALRLGEDDAVGGVQPERIGGGEVARDHQQDLPRRQKRHNAPQHVMVVACLRA